MIFKSSIDSKIDKSLKAASNALFIVAIVTDGYKVLALYMRIEMTKSIHFHIEP